MAPLSISGYALLRVYMEIIGAPLDTTTTVHSWQIHKYLQEALSSRPNYNNIMDEEQHKCWMGHLIRLMKTDWRTNVRNMRTNKVLG